MSTDPFDAAGPTALGSSSARPGALQRVTRSLEGATESNATSEPGAAFAGLVKDLIADTNRAQNEAQRLATDLARGEADIVDTIVALDEADLKLRLAVEVRNRVLAAWQEITHAGRA